MKRDSLNMSKYYSSDYNSLYPILVENKLIRNKVPWNGNFHFCLDENFEPIIEGWIQYEKDGNVESVSFRFNHAKSKWEEYHFV